MIDPGLAMERRHINPRGYLTDRGGVVADAADEDAAVAESYIHMYIKNQKLYIYIYIYVYLYI